MIRNDRLVHDFLNGLVVGNIGNEHIKIRCHGTKFYSYNRLIAQFIINNRGRIVLIVHCPDNSKGIESHYSLLITEAIEIHDKSRRFPIMECQDERFHDDYRKLYETNKDKFNRIA